MPTMRRGISREPSPVDGRSRLRPTMFMRRVDENQQMIIYQCDRSGCQEQEREDEAGAFIIAYHAEDRETPIAICCSLDCLMHWTAANSTAPSEHQP
jgi:hypothetical protein